MQLTFSLPNPHYNNQRDRKTGEIYINPGKLGRVACCIDGIGLRKDFTTGPTLGSNGWDSTQAPKIRAALNRNRKAMSHPEKRKFKHFQKYTSTYIWIRERKVGITAKLTWWAHLVRQSAKKQGCCPSRLLTRTVMVLADERQDLPFATTNIKEKILSPAVCFPVPCLPPL